MSDFRNRHLFLLEKKEDEGLLPLFVYIRKNILSSANHSGDSKPHKALLFSLL
jgi:hypothetical protein